MGRKNKNTLGGAASGAAAGSAAGPWGALAGGVLGGVMGSQQDTDATQIAPAVPQDVVDKLYAQANGSQPTIGELKGAQMYDKTLAAQIAGAKASRGVSPGLLSRNVNRIAAEQSQANAQNAAILSAEERNQAMAKYLQAQQLNAQINVQNAGYEAAADKKADGMLGAGLSAAAGSLALGAQKSDAAAQMEAKDQKAATDSNTQKDSLKLQTYDNAPQSSYGQSMYKLPDYSMGADTMKVTSDERQKNLISNESLPQNNNLQTQTQQAIQPAAAPAAPSVAQPAQATPQASAPQAAPAQVPVTPGITAQMLQQAQKSSKKGGNVSDIQNATNMLQDGSSGPNAQEILAMSMDAQQRQTRDIFGNVTQSDADNYGANLQRWHSANEAKRVAFQKEQGNVDEQNLINDATRTSRLNRFYTGIDTGGVAVASQFRPKQASVDSSWGAAQQAQRNAGIGDQSRGYNYAPVVAGAVLAGVPGIIAGDQMSRTSDETQKTDKKAEGSADFNPKSFLDKLQAYSYEYKKSAEGLPGVEPGRQLSVMAQDLEKAGPVGQNMVDEDANGNKVVDYGKGFAAILASQAQLNERLSKIESKKKKV